ncbi:phage tail family protein [Streptomyces lunaelactis]|uniref:phage distal tail protein n=1 Tax=Streptomyces lunaelactis TaxID=1535768 RepID=UPI001585B58A|nr:phage tail domain-containing protein [Streptomyces lunaelactis]NUK09745.1 phage tail family protein [Streptomyces lunaelactis]
MAAGDKVTRPGHVQFGDELLLGPDSPYRWRSLSGWEELPALDSGSVNRSDGHGSYPGRLLAQARTISLDDVIVRAPRGTIGAVVGALNAATAVNDTEQPLVIWLDERGPLLSFARVLRRAVPVGNGYRLGTITGAAIQWEASDPRRYSLIEQQATTSLPSPEPGLDWQVNPGPERLTYPLAFGTPGSTGTMLAVNDGDAPSHPVITFRGPVSRPSVTNLRTGEALEYDIDLAADDELLVDTHEGTVTLNNSASRLYTATARSVPEQSLDLAPGATSLLFRAAPGSNDSRAAASIRWRSALW